MILFEKIQFSGNKRSIIARIIIVILLLAFAVLVSIDPFCWTPFFPLDLVIHEIGHPLFGLFGEWMGYAGGTILQHLVPIICCAILLKQGEYFAIPLCGIWFSANILETARYIVSTEQPDLQLLTLGISGEEAEIRYTDWEYLLDNIPGLSMEYASTVGFVIKSCGIISSWFFVAIAFWMLWCMYKGRKDKQLK